MTEEQIKSALFQVLRTIAPETDPATIGPGENLREALDIDSFDFLKFIVGIHERLAVEIPESDYRELFTLTSSLRYLSKKV